MQFSDTEIKMCEMVSFVKREMNVLRQEINAWNSRNPKCSDRK